MPDIPSLGVDRVDIIDPGVTNVEEQAYPADLRVTTLPTPRELAALLAASLFAPARPTNDVTVVTFATPSEANVNAQSNVQPSQNIGTAVNTPAEVDVENQVYGTPADVAEFLITEDGSFRTNQAETEDTLLLRVTAYNATTRTMTVVRHDNGANPDLTGFGVSLLGREGDFDSTTPTVALRTVDFVIGAFGGNTVTFDTAPSTNPAVNDRFFVEVGREGPEVINDVFSNKLNVTIAPAPPVATTEAAPNQPTQGNIAASSGVAGAGVITGGTAAPRLLGTFFVEREDPDTGMGPPIIDVYR